MIEVMIVVAIVAILSAIAIPSYNEYIQRGRIVQGVSTLSDMQVRLEQYFQDQRTYVAACSAANPNTIAPIPAATAFFVYSCPVIAAGAYQVDATGQGAMAGFTYRLALAGGAVTRTTVALPAGWTLPANNNCWALKKDGSC